MVRTASAAGAAAVAQLTGSLQGSGQLNRGREVDLTALLGQNRWSSPYEILDRACQLSLSAAV